MCGIAGIYRANREVHTAELKKMARAIDHRGPDNKGLFVEKSLGLAHTRLAIIDLTPKGNQPLFSEDKEIILVANAEIYNFIELRKELSKKGCVFQTNSDCETIIHAYRVYGLDFIKKLYGMFAFALFDKKDKRLILARDRLGIKPLYFSLHNGSLLFGSEIKAILPLLEKTEINIKALTHFFLNQFSTGRETIFINIKRVLPGEILIIDKNLKINKYIYWKLEQIESKKISEKEALEEFDDLFPKVVSQHLRADVPYGLFLSGGVDSGTILALLAKLQDRRIRTFSIGYKEVKMKDELIYAEEIAKRFNTQHTSIPVTKDQLFYIIPYTIWCIDDLMRDYASFPTTILSFAASKELKVVLTGEGGDEVFAGYGRYRSGIIERMVKNLIHPGSGGFRTRGTISKKWINKIFPSRIKKIASTYREPFCELWKKSNHKWSSLQKFQYIDIKSALPDNLLVKVDRTTMGYGLEARVPFLDHRIVEFGFSLPDSLKIRSHEGKFFVKKWAEKYLPKEHLYKPKSGFKVPVSEWLKGDFLSSLKGKLKNNPTIRYYFNVSNFDELFSQAQKEKKHAVRCVWCLMQFAIWENLFLEHKGSLKPSDKENPLDWIR